MIGQEILAIIYLAPFLLSLCSGMMQVPVCQCDALVTEASPADYDLLCVAGLAVQKVQQLAVGFAVAHLPEPVQHSRALHVVLMRLRLPTQNAMCRRNVRGDAWAGGRRGSRDILGTAFACEVLAERCVGCARSTALGWKPRGSPCSRFASPMLSDCRLRCRAALRPCASCPIVKAHESGAKLAASAPCSGLGI